MLKACLGIVMSFGVSACGAASSDKVAHAQKSVDGFGEIKLGTPLQVALTPSIADTFNPLAMKACWEDLPLKGCLLSPRDRSSPFIIAEGIPFDLSLSFNRLNKLTRIDLGYERKGGISREQCLELHDRTLDWLWTDYGAFAEPTVKDSETWSPRITGGGHHYSIGNFDDGGFATRPKRTLKNIEDLPSRPRAILKWNDDRYVWLLTSYIVGSGGTCRVNIGFSEPESAE